MKTSVKKMSVLLIALITAAVMTFSAAAEGTDPIYSADELFTDRDLEQEADLSKAVMMTVKDGEDLTITDAGVYVISGSASDATVYVEADKDDKVQIVLDGVTVANGSHPAIWVKTADKVFVTVAADSALSVTGTFESDGGSKVNGVIFSKTDLVINGTAALKITSSAHGVVCKDDLKITGGSITVDAASSAVKANDSIRISGGVLDLTAGTDGLHSENDDDDTLGYIYIGGGSIVIRAGDDGIHATSVVQIDGGSVSVTAAEGIEGTYIQINGGRIDVRATDDGINAGRKSTAYPVTVVFNDGDITVAVGSGDTDGVDSNGSIIVNGGTVSVTGNSAFDYDSSAQYNGGTIIVNGQQVSSIPNQMMGGRGGWNNGGRDGRNGDGWNGGGNPGGEWGNPGGGWGRH